MGRIRACLGAKEIKTEVKDSGIEAASPAGKDKKLIARGEARDEIAKMRAAGVENAANRIGRFR